MPALDIPLAQAEQLLTQRIESGRELLQRIHAFSGGPTFAGSPPTLATGLPEELRRHLERWHDFNRTWVDVHLGMPISKEYETLGDYTDLHLGLYMADQAARAASDRVRQELLLLESIRDRLPIWAPEPQAGPNSGHETRTSHNAPIFIVHGSDTLRAESVAHTVSTATGRKIIILRDQPNLGQTLIEKFEQHAAEASYAIIVLTPDDHGSRTSEAGTRPRGRQNVIFEMGYFYGLIGRRNVSVLIRPGVEKPSDTDGIAYITYGDDRAWKTELLRELKHAGFEIHL